MKFIKNQCIRINGEKFRILRVWRAGNRAVAMNVEGYKISLPNDIYNVETGW